MKDRRLFRTFPRFIQDQQNRMVLSVATVLPVSSRDRYISLICCLGQCLYGTRQFVHQWVLF